ncbi:MAG: hypothetical protein ACYST6_13145 [Planctomycetota bacterium]
MRITRIIALLALVAVVLLVCIPLIRGPGQSDASSNELPAKVRDYIDTPLVLKIVHDGERVVWSTRSFFLDPVKFTRRWTADRKQFPSPIKALSWAIGLTSILFVLYRIAFPKSAMFQLIQQSEDRLADQQRSSDENNALPTLVGVGPAYALLPKFDFPEAGGTQAKQLMVARCGCLRCTIQNAIPESVRGKLSFIVFFLEFAFIATLSTYPTALLFGTNLSLGDAFAFISLIFALYMAVVAISLTVLLFAYVHVPHAYHIDLTGRAADVGCLIGCLATLLLFSIRLTILVAIGRTYFLAFQTLYGLDTFATVCTLVSGILLSPVLGTALYLPTVFLLLRAAKLIKALC